MLPLLEPLDRRAVDADGSGGVGRSLDWASGVGSVHLAGDLKLALVEADVFPAERSGFGGAEAVAAAEVDEDADRTVGDIEQAA